MKDQTQPAEALLELLRETFGEPPPIDACEELDRRRLQSQALMDRMMTVMEERYPGFEAALSRVVKRIEELEKPVGVA